ncbi:hypothetical protein KC358_g46 [Hortaea werneckii]|nr:hypothetical protein KC358_g46 [Hortaea werneckii]
MRRGAGGQGEDDFVAVRADDGVPGIEGLVLGEENAALAAAAFEHVDLVCHAACSVYPLRFIPVLRSILNTIWEDAAVVSSAGPMEYRLSPTQVRSVKYVAK